jgi:hypothetical protein
MPSADQPSVAEVLINFRAGGVRTGKYRYMLSVPLYDGKEQNTSKSIIELEVIGKFCAQKSSLEVTTNERAAAVFNHTDGILIRSLHAADVDGLPIPEAYARQEVIEVNLMTNSTGKLDRFKMGYDRTKQRY